MNNKSNVEQKKKGAKSPESSVRDTEARGFRDVSQDLIAEANQNNRAILKLVEGLNRTDLIDDAITVALHTIRESFDWAYGSFWILSTEDDQLHFALESGRVSEGFRTLTQETSFPKGTGLSGRAWKQEELLHTSDLSAVRDCVRAPEAQKAGVKSGVCFPIYRNGQVHGTMDFFALEEIEFSDDRLDTLRQAGKMVSDAIDRIDRMDEQKELATNSRAINTVLEVLNQAQEETDALRSALDTLRDVFGWNYASFWKHDPENQVLRFDVESGSVNEDFRRVTQETTLREGVGISGRAWRQRQLIHTDDIGQMTDCARAPIARKAGVRTGICFPIEVNGSIYGTMDFFSTKVLHISDDRKQALEKVASMVSGAIERIVKQQEN